MSDANVAGKMSKSLGKGVQWLPSKNNKELVRLRNGYLTSATVATQVSYEWGHSTAWVSSQSAVGVATSNIYMDSMRMSLSK